MEPDLNSLSDIVFEKDVANLSSERPEKMDLYLPPATRRHDTQFPAIVLIHGGGWSLLDKSNQRQVFLAIILAQAGFVVANINYKLTTETQKAWPTNIHDCKAAIRFLRKNAKRYLVDTDRIATMGTSAGGHLALLAAYTGDTGNVVLKCPLYPEYSDSVQAVIDFYGIPDVHYPIVNLPYPSGELFLPATLEQDATLYDWASPSFWVNESCPPTLVMHGTADTVVTIDHSDRFVQILKQKSVRHEYHRIENAVHSFGFTPPQKDLRPIVLEFLCEHLR